MHACVYACNAHACGRTENYLNVQTTFHQQQQQQTPKPYKP